MNPEEFPLIPELLCRNTFTGGTDELKDMDTNVIQPCMQWQFEMSFNGVVIFFSRFFGLCQFFTGASFTCITPYVFVMIVESLMKALLCLAYILFVANQTGNAVD